MPKDKKQDWEKDLEEKFKLWAFNDDDPEQALTGVQAKIVWEYFKPLLLSQRKEVIEECIKEVEKISTFSFLGQLNHQLYFKKQVIKILNKLK